LTGRSPCEAVRDWEAKLTSALAEELRRSRKGKVGRSWYADETYIRVHGDWKYFYRAIDRNGTLVDAMLSEHRNLAAAKRFFRSAKTVPGVIPDRVTTDGHDAYPRAIRMELGSRVWHRTNCYLNNRLEQDHRGIKGRCRPRLGFKSIASARRYCRRFQTTRRTPMSETTTPFQALRQDIRADFASIERRLTVLMWQGTAVIALMLLIGVPMLWLLIRLAAIAGALG
jgi:putative transposase